MYLIYLNMNIPFKEYLIKFPFLSKLNFDVCEKYL